MGLSVPDLAIIITQKCCPGKQSSCHHYIISSFGQRLLSGQEADAAVPGQSLGDRGLFEAGSGCHKDSSSVCLPRGS